MLNFKIDSTTYRSRTLISKLTGLSSNLSLFMTSVSSGHVLAAQVEIPKVVNDILTLKREGITFESSLTFIKLRYTDFSLLTQDEVKILTATYYQFQLELIRLKKHLMGGLNETHR